MEQRKGVFAEGGAIEDWSAINPAMSEKSPHILGSFARILDQSTTDLNTMAGLVVRSLDNAMRGLLDRNSDLCSTVIADDEEIDRLEVKIDEEGMRIMMLFHCPRTRWN